MEKKIQTSIAQNIKKYRLLNNMTQKELSEKLFLDTQYYAQLERGERNFSVEKIAMICSLFNIGIENVIELDENTDSGKETTLLLKEVSSSLKPLTYSQLQVVKKFIQEIIPYTS